MTILSFLSFYWGALHLIIVSVDASINHPTKKPKSRVNKLDKNGFRKDPALEKWIHESGIDDCNIPRLAGPTLDVQALRSSMEKSEPVLLSWPEEFRASWKFNDILQTRDEGDILLFMRPVVGRSSIGNIEFNTTFSMYLNLMQQATLPRELTKFHSAGLVFSGFDDILQIHNERDGLVPMNASISTCSLVNQVIERGGCSAYLSLGFSRVGLPFHRHKAFSYTVEQGRKMFALMRPGSLERKDKEIREDLTVLPPVVAMNRHSELFASNEMLRCILEPGESLIVPSHWNHLTLAVGDSLGMSYQFHYVKEQAPERAFWTDWCETLVPQLVLCGSQMDCIDGHFYTLTKEQMTTATVQAPMHQCVAPVFALYWHPRDSRQAATILLSNADSYVSMVSKGLEPLVAAEIISTWAEIAEHFLKDAMLALKLARIADSFFEKGGYWRVAVQRGNHQDGKKLYKRLQKQLQFTDAPACELRMCLTERGLLPQEPARSEL